MDNCCILCRYIVRTCNVDLFSGTETVAVLDSTRTGTQSVYHASCEILIRVNTKRCDKCKKYRNVLSAMVSRPRKDDRTNPSSHTTYVNLSTPEKNQRLSLLHQENRKAKQQIRRLNQKLEAITVQQGVNLSDELHNDIKQIASTNTQEIYSRYPENSFQRLFWDQQTKASSYQSSKSMKWHPLFIKWCLYLRHLSGKSYEHLRQSGCLKLPSQATLRDYTHYIPTKTGFSTEVDRDLLDVAFLNNDLNRYVMIIMDEVHIKNDLVYDKHQGCLVGFIDLGNTNNRLLEFESALCGDKSQPQLALSMLVLMVRGLFYKLNYPYVQFACSSISGDLMFDPVWEAVSRLERLGFRVLGLTCDGGSPNRRLWKLHSEKEELIYKVPNLFASDGPRFLYFISDPPHLIKTIRNSFCNSKRKLWVSELMWFMLNYV